jgi:Starch-binding associating with outer membrane
MKMKRIYNSLLAGLLTIVMVTGCDTDALHDLNINPQALNQINMNFLFTRAQLGAASGGDVGDNRYIDWRTNVGFAAHAIQQLATTGTSNIGCGDKYCDYFEQNDAPFDFIYGGQLNGISEILKQTGPGGFDEGNKNNMRQATRILRAFLFHRLTDYYGAVPYSEASQATNVGGAFFPKYDKQSVIYKDLLKELDEATAAFTAADATDGFAAADLYYSGDVAKWKKWGYSLMLRMAMRVSNVDAALANTYVAKAVAGGVFTSNADNTWVPMALSPSEWTNQNGISRAMYPGDGGQANNSFLSKTLVDWLKGTDKTIVGDDDPRLMIFTKGIASWDAASFVVTNGDPLQQKGMPNGYDQAGLNTLEGSTADNNTRYSKVNWLMFQDDEPYMLMNYGEVKLLLAEAAQRSIGGVTGAKAHYDEGVKASMQMYTPYDASLTVSDAAVDTYLATYVYGTHKPALEMIGEQLWANKWMNWWDAWSDYRRTGFPNLTPTNYPGNETNGTIPVKLKIPEREVSGNKFFKETGTLPNLYTTKVWWDGGTE